MDTGDQSRMPEGEQVELFDANELPLGIELLLPEEAQRKRYTGEVVARNLAKYQMIVDALAQDLPVRMICKAFGVSPGTVQGIREREPALVVTERLKMSKLFGQAARLCVETLIERIHGGSVPANVLPVAAGIFWDKKSLIDGEATSRVEHVSERMPTIEEMARELKQLAVQSETHSEENPPKTQ